MEDHADPLFNQNMAEINKLNTASGSMIKALVIALGSNGSTLLRLTNAEPEGHRVEYALVQGDAALVKLIGLNLGLIITDTFLEARHA